MDPVWLKIIFIDRIDQNVVVLRIKYRSWDN
jgi:hypothetical protein